MEMTDRGLCPVADPSALFLADRRPDAPGSVVACVMEGTRPLCVEVQALVSDHTAVLARRVAQAIDQSRLSMLVAVLQERARVRLKERDVYASIAGNVRVGEPGADLAVALAIAGAESGRAIEADTAVMGEIGLGGEVRQMPHAPRRLGEVARLGFGRAVVPASTPDVPGLELIRVPDLGHALDATGLRAD
jgi:DNA repair protein RadA/Sms